MSLKEVLGRIDEQGLIDFTCRLVQIPSINPPADYSQIAPLMKEKMEKFALKTAIMEGQTGKRNVVALWEGTPQAKRTLLLGGHMDVVSAGDESAWRFPPFSATIADDAIWGRGTVDMKGAIAAALYAIKAVKEVHNRLPLNVLLGATVDDETAGDMGNKYVIEEGLIKAGWPLPTLHVLGEANDLNITGTFKGRIWLKIVLQGKSAHGGAPQDGVNAIEKMTELLRRILNMERDTQPQLGQDTLNIGTIKGGSKVNIVADECEATFDYRTCFLSFEEAQAKIFAIIQQMQKEDPQFTLKEFSVFEKRDPVSIASDSEEVLLLNKAIKAVLNRDSEFKGALSAGDAFHTMRKGIPGVWVGPGDVSLLHAVNEHLKIEDLINAAKVYASIILEYADIS